MLVIILFVLLLVGQLSALIFIGNNIMTFKKLIGKKECWQSFIL
jgi:hypothetical protein